MNGKQKCRILKQIRQQIAEANDIDLVIAECTHKGDCRGTCPRCEAEVRYLEQALEKRRALQKRIALVGISAGVTLALSGCATIEALVDIAGLDRGGGRGTDDLTGLVPCIETPAPPEVFVTDGEVAPLQFDDEESAAQSDGTDAPEPEAPASEGD